MVVNRFGFGQHVPAPTNTGRPEVARGPYTTKFLEYGRIEDLPHRVLTDKCRTSMAAPSDLSMDLLRRSAQVPSWKPYATTRTLTLTRTLTRTHTRTHSDTAIMCTG